VTKKLTLVGGIVIKAEFLALAPIIPIKTEVHTYPLIQVNEALDDLRHGRFTGAAVIILG